MSEVLSLLDTERLADRTLAAICSAQGRMRGIVVLPLAFDVDRERVASDVAGLRRHGSMLAGDCERCGPDVDYPCDDARRYFDGLRRTAALYGVT